MVATNAPALPAHLPCLLQRAVRQTGRGEVQVAEAYAPVTSGHARKVWSELIATLPGELCSPGSMPVCATCSPITYVPQLHRRECLYPHHSTTARALAALPTGDQWVAAPISCFATLLILLLHAGTPVCLSCLAWLLTRAGHIMYLAPIRPLGPSGVPTAATRSDDRGPMPCARSDKIDIFVNAGHASSCLSPSTPKKGEQEGRGAAAADAEAAATRSHLQAFIILAKGVAELPSSLERQEVRK